MLSLKLVTVLKLTLSSLPYFNAKYMRLLHITFEFLEKVFAFSYSWFKSYQFADWGELKELFMSGALGCWAMASLVLCFYV